MTRRNEPCPCGSGKRFKRCHGVLDGPNGLFARQQAALRALELHRANERIREAQQGEGRPIVALEVGDHQFVAVGLSLYPMKDCKTFPDFLARYIQIKLGAEWGTAELAKPLTERHPIMQWFDAIGRYRLVEAKGKPPGEIHESVITGAVACYMGLAYGLFLLDHNVELQERLLRRLKDVGNFAGAYYEIIIARLLIRAGFTLELEDETDGDSKHCEFSATSKVTERKYWVEAKMRSIAGVLGKTEGNDRKPLKMLVPHLNKAFAKPAADHPRLIFVDLNTAEGLQGDPRNPRWFPDAVARLSKYEREKLPAGESAHVFVTNIAYHRQMDSAPTSVVLPYGLGNDFERPGEIRLSDWYRRRRRHSDAHKIVEAFGRDLVFPVTFDGSLPSEKYGGRMRPIIGETYFFPQLSENGQEATVTGAHVDEASGEMVLVLADQRGKFSFVREKMSAAELADYKQHPDAYFGRIVPRERRADTPFELFEFLVDSYKALTRDKLIANLQGHPGLFPQSMSDDDLLLLFCEQQVANIMARKS
jgi:hypothetical protein